MPIRRSDGLQLPTATVHGGNLQEMRMKAPDKEKAFIIHTELGGGVNNQLIAIAKAIMLANTTGSQFVLPCIRADAHNGARSHFSRMFDQDHFTTEVWRRYSVKVLDMRCGTSEYDAYTSKLPRIDAREPAVTSVMAGQPRNDTIFAMNEFVLTNPFSAQYGLDIPLFVGTLRQSPRLSNLTKHIVTSLRGKVRISPQPHAKGMGLKWCGFNEEQLRVIGLHLRTEHDLVERCLTYVNMNMEDCAPNATTVATYVCEKFGVPCDRLIVYVATGSDRSTYMDVLSPYFHQVVDKHDFLGNVTALGLGFQEFALVEEFVLAELDMFIGSSGSTMTGMVVAMRELGGKKDTFLSYAPANVATFCFRANKAFFKRGGCTPSSDSPCFALPP